MDIKVIQKEIERHAQAMNTLIRELKTHILALPDNPRINRISNAPQCFTIKSKDLGNNWTAEYHDFKKQYELIVKELEASELSNAFNKLYKIINESKVVYSSSGHGGCPRTTHTLNLHPDVVRYLRKFANMPPTNCPACNGDRDWAGDKIKAEFHFCGRTGAD